MITAKEARNLYNERKNLVCEAEQELSKLSKKIEEMAYAGQTKIITEVSSNNVVLSHVLETLRKLGYGWAIDLDVADKTVLTIWW